MDLQVKDPAAREPTILFWDPTFGRAEGALVDDGCLADGQAEEEPIVGVQLDPGQAAVPDGAPLFVMSDGPKAAAVWVIEPTPRRLGCIVGPEAQQVLDICRNRVRGLQAIVLPQSDAKPGGELRVQVHAV